MFEHGQCVVTPAGEAGKVVAPFGRTAADFYETGPDRLITARAVRQDGDVPRCVEDAFEPLARPPHDRGEVDPIVLRVGPR